MENKLTLRINAKKIREKLPIAEISDQLCEKIRKSEDYKTAKNVMIFYPAKYEINFLDLLNDKKNFYLPRVKGDDLEVCPYKSGDELVLSKYKIQEPVSQAINSQILDIVIVPALMLDKNGYRLGYGGGFYDRFLEKYGKNFKTLCAVPKELFVEKLPLENHDVKIDIIMVN